MKDFYCVFVCTEMNLIAFSGPRNCVNTQYAVLSGAMHVHDQIQIILHKFPSLNYTGCIAKNRLVFNSWCKFKIIAQNVPSLGPLKRFTLPEQS